MCTLATLLRNTLLVVAPFLLSSAALAMSCEELRASVAAKIQSKGVARFSLSIVDVGTSAVGQVVGTCERGSKKLVYAQGIGPEPGKVPVSSQALPASSPSSRVITECADGRVITQGSCRR
jgi:hypothetical protein